MKNWISNVSFGKKLFALLVLPVIVMLLFSGKEVSRDLNRVGEMRDMVRLTDLAIASGNLVHDVQAERGATALFVASGGRRFADQLKKLRAATDSSIGAFEGESVKVKSELPKFAARLDEVHEKLAQVIRARAKADTLAAPVTELVPVYTVLVRSLIDTTALYARNTGDAHIGDLLRGYSALNNIKEVTGRERALLSSAFTAGNLNAADFLALRDLLQARRTYEATLATLAPAELLQIVAKFKDTAEVKEFNRIESFAAGKGGAGALAGIDSEYWYGVATRRINNLHDAETEIQSLLRTAAATMRSEAMRNLWRDAVIVLAGLMSAVMLGLLITHNITRRLKGTLVDIDTMVNGNLTVRAADSGGDELGTFVSGLNRLADRMHVVLRSVNEASHAIRDSSTRLTQTASVLSSGTEQTSVQSRIIADATIEVTRKLESLSSAIEEMSISIGEISKHGAQAARMAAEANEAVTQSARTIDELGHSAEDIGTVTQMISFVADQTKMLALNASIEAAGAGEAGKGFSVVASEVKELARQTADSTEEIRAKIEAIQSRTNNAVDTVSRIGDFVGRLRDINSSIASTVEEQSMVVREIAEHISSAVAAANEVSNNISGISTAAAEGAREASESSGQAKSMLELSGRLNQVMSGFTV